MTITLNLLPDLEARFLAEANATGVPVSEVVRAHLYAFSAYSLKPPTAEEIDNAFEEVADLIPDSIPPLSHEAVSRESIYTREDDWNQ